VITYYAVYTGLLLAAFLGRSGRKLRAGLYWVVLFGLLMFSALRFEVGCDWVGYLINFWSVEGRNYEFDLTSQNPGYWELIALLHDYGLSYQWLNIATSAIFFLGLHALARRQPNPLTFLVLTFPILIINMPMSAIKQAAAIGFLCFAYVAFIDRRLVFYVGWILLGAAFHSSVLIFLLFIPFVRGEFNRRSLLLGLLLAAPGAYALLQTEGAEIAASRYIDSGLDAAGAAFRLGILTLSGAFFLWALAPAWRRQFPADYKLVWISSWMMVGFFSLFFVSSVIGDRFGYYLIPIQAMIFARIPYLHLGDSRKFYAFVPYAALTLVFVVWTQISWIFDVCYTPYRFGFG